MERRDFFGVLGVALAWPLAVRAQQPAMPVVGFLNSQSPDGYAHFLRGFRQGLKEVGYIEGENVGIEYAWANNKIDRLSALTAELVRRKVAVIVASGLLASVSAIKATTTVPIVFMVPVDPVELGLVASLARPVGNATGINFFSAELAAKRLDILRALVPRIARVAVLINPAEAAIANANLRGIETAAHAMGLQVQILNASTSSEIDVAFADFVRERFDALFISSGVFFLARRIQLANLAISHAAPVIFGTRDYAEAGGLMSYGANLEDAHRQAGIYAGRILKGAKPGDIPVMQPTKFELVINLKTAKAIGLAMPPALLTSADEVIE